MKEKFSAKIENLQKSHQEHKLEQNLIHTFKNYTKGILEDLEYLNESPQLNNAITLVNVVRDVLNKIGEDRSYFQHYIKFLNTVRQFDRELEQKIEAMKRAYEYTNSEKFRVEIKKTPSQLQTIINSLHNIIDEYKLDLVEEERKKIEELETRSSQVGDNSAENTFSTKSIKLFFKKLHYSKGKDELIQEYGDKAPVHYKLQAWMYDMKHPEEIEANQIKIQAFRKKMNKKQLEQIQQLLQASEELKIFRNYTFQIHELLLKFETNGDFEHVKFLGKKWLDFLDQFSSDLSEKNYSVQSIIEIRKLIREEFRIKEDWLERVKVKYENPIYLNPNEATINDKEFPDFASDLTTIRQEYIKLKEDKRILKKINQEENQKQKEIIEKEREKKKLEKEKIKEERLEKQRLERERLENEKLEKRRLEKERLEKEKLEKQRLEKERLEKEKLEKQRLEKERLEKEKLEKQRLEKERLEKEKNRKELTQKKTSIPKPIKSPKKKTTASKSKKITKKKTSIAKSKKTVGKKTSEKSN
ncbi:MAG: hypothetical protein ACTSVU_00175 [Promethearchaeota archaeon]